MRNTHVCSKESGATLLEQIVFTSQSCIGCVTEGVNLTLTGTVFETPSPMCKTVHLDSPGIDYADRGVFIAEEQEIDMGWETCYQV